MNNKLFAVVNLGSLKAKLMVFNTETLDVVFQKSYMTLLGKNMSEGGTFVKEVLGRLDEALLFIKKELNNLNCSNVKFIATESLRIAKSREDVYRIIEKYFPKHKITILDQGIEGEMFFKVVSQCFEGEPIAAMDVGGGSVQILNGIFRSNECLIDSKYLYKTGTYTLQQKYSPDSSIVRQEFDKALDEIKRDFDSLNSRNDVLVFGSTCMQDFLNESGVSLYNDRPIKKHPTYTTIKDLKDLLFEIRKVAPDSRFHFYPSGEHFIYGADYLLINVIEAAERLDAKYIYPSNMNSSYGFIK